MHCDATSCASILFLSFSFLLVVCCTRARKAEKERRRLYGSIGGACAATTPPVPLPLRPRDTSTIANPAPEYHQYHCHCHQSIVQRHTAISSSGRRRLETWDRSCDQANLPASQAAPVKTVWCHLHWCRCFLVKSGRNQKESKSGKHGYEEGCKYCCRGSRRG